MRSVFLMVFNLFDENTHLNIKLFFSRFWQPSQIFFFFLYGPKQSKQFLWQKLQGSQRVSTNKHRLLGFCLMAQKLCREGSRTVFSFLWSLTCYRVFWITLDNKHILCTALHSSLILFWIWAAILKNPWRTLTRNLFK